MLSSTEFEWHPALFFQHRQPGLLRLGERSNDPSTKLALVVLNQPLEDLHTLYRVWRNTFLHIAADGGANRVCMAQKHGTKMPWLVPTSVQDPFPKLDAIIGDLDSITDDVRSWFENRGTEIIHCPDQDSTDFGKAVAHIRSHYPQPLDIIAMGGLGGRVDQGISQLHHLYLFQQGEGYPHGRMYLLSHESITFLLKEGKHKIHVREGEEEVFGKYVGILPIKEPSVITTFGLEWDVENWTTEFGGQMSTSNHVLPETEVVEIWTTKDVVFTIDLKNMRSNGAGERVG